MPGWRRSRKARSALVLALALTHAVALVGCVRAPLRGRAKPVVETGPAPVEPPPPPERPRTPEMLELDALAREVGALVTPVENPCVEGRPGNCYRRALDRLFVRLDALQEDPRSQVRILQLGDSHIAADYITGTIRERLQASFGNGGRGFLHVEQREQYGGRRLSRRGPWRRTRMVDKGQDGQPFGFSGHAIESMGAGAWVEYALIDAHRVTLYYHATPGAADMTVTVDGELVGKVDTASKRPESDYKSVVIPRKEGKDGRVLRITANGKGVRLIGISFEREDGGLLYDSVGPVGADARVYLSASEDSFREHLKVLRPDLVVLMLGGNDLLRVRRGDMTLEQTRLDLEALIARVQDALPDADCMVWSPMDAGERKGRDIESKDRIGEMRYVQREAARNRGCGFWDMYAAMGGDGSIGRWAAKNIINRDLIHPRRRAGELLGHLFADGFFAAYDNP